MSLLAQSLRVGFELPEAIDGLSRAMPELRLAIESQKVDDLYIGGAALTERPSELWLEAMTGLQATWMSWDSGWLLAGESYFFSPSVGANFAARKIDRQATEAGAVAGGCSGQQAFGVACA